MTERKKLRRYPSHNLIATFDADATIKTISETLGIDRRSVWRWKKYNPTLDVFAADRYAVRIGHHPASVWPEWLIGDSMGREGKSHI